MATSLMEDTRAVRVGQLQSTPISGQQDIIEFMT